MVDLVFDVIIIKQMSAFRRLHVDGKSMTINLLLFLVTIPRTAKSQEIFKLVRLCHISVRVETCKAQSGLTQRYNCQMFGHVWANGRQPARCLWFGGGHLYREWEGKGKETQTLAWYNCQFREGEKTPPSNFQDCSHAEELRKRKLLTEHKAATGKVFSSTFTTPTLSFAAVLPKNTEQQRPNPHQVAMAGPATIDRSVPEPSQHQQQQIGQSVRVPNANSFPLYYTLSVLTAEQQTMTEISG
jgi:hypothetical protein